MKNQIYEYIAPLIENITMERYFFVYETLKKSLGRGFERNAFWIGVYGILHMLEETGEILPKNALYADITIAGSKIHYPFIQNAKSYKSLLEEAIREGEKGGEEDLQGANLWII